MHSYLIIFIPTSLLESFFSWPPITSCCWSGWPLLGCILLDPTAAVTTMDPALLHHSPSVLGIWKLQFANILVHHLHSPPHSLSFEHESNQDLSLKVFSISFITFKISLIIKALIRLYTLKILTQTPPLNSRLVYSVHQQNSLDTYQVRMDGLLKWGKFWLDSYIC